MGRNFQVVVISPIPFYGPDRETGIQRLRVVGSPGTKMLKARFPSPLHLYASCYNWSFKISVFLGNSGDGVKLALGLSHREASSTWRKTYSFVLFVSENYCPHRKNKWFRMCCPLANFSFANIPWILHCNGVHTQQSFPIHHIPCLTQPACCILTEGSYHCASCWSPTPFSALLLAFCSGSSSRPPLILVFLETIVFLSHYKTLGGTDCWPPYPDKNIKAVRAPHLVAPVKLSRVVSHRCSLVHKIVLPICWGVFQYLPWLSSCSWRRKKSHPVLAVEDPVQMYLNWTPFWCQVSQWFKRLVGWRQHQLWKLGFSFTS